MFTVGSDGHMAAKPGMTDRRRRRAIALGTVTVVVAVGVVGTLAAPVLGSVDVIDYYRVADGNVLTVGVVSGAGTWTRVTQVDESASSVIVTVRSLSIPFLAGSAVGHRLELEVALSQPLADRSVIDATGHSVPEQPPTTTAP
jgi:hypothetical protein